MPVQAQSADGVMHEFPDGTAQEAIDRAMKGYAAQQPTKSSGVGDFFKSIPTQHGAWRADRIRTTRTSVYR